MPIPVQTKTRPALLDQTGRQLTIGQQLGSGGEGIVFEVRDRPELVAKLYHHPLDPNKAAKIVAMTSTKTERLLKLTAWPVEVVKDSNRMVVGFLMPRLSGHQVAFNLYSPKLRLQNFQNASWQFLIRTATNAALAFNVIHEHGHVIGDVNHGNLVVSDRATVRLIDCDSYQITINGTRWFCEVGVPTHQPPEMQNLKSYKGYARTPNHDNFGLAVIIFQMLFMARHPFSGRFLGSGEMPMERAISEYRFAYSANPVQMQPPPASLGLNGVTPQVAQLFERAFSRQGTQQGRPTARDWVAALQDLEKHLKKCSVNVSHQFVDSLSSCPWCDIEVATGVPLFPVALVGPTQTGFTILSFWAKVSAVPNPGPPPPLPRTDGMATTLSPDALELQQATFGARLKSGLLSLIGAPNRIQTLKQKVQAQAIGARTRWQNLQGNWNSYAGSKDFQDILAQLQSLRGQYEALQQKRLQALQTLEANLYVTQLHAHLDRCRIANVRIKGVGPAKKTTLQSYGIETAADITEKRVLGVPGFGPVLASTLAKWRFQQERRFVFDPKKGVDPAAKNAVERHILTERVDLERKLNEGLSTLIVSSHHINTRRQKLLRDAEQIAHEFVQAEADLRAASAVSAIVPGKRAVIAIGAMAIGGAIIASSVGRAPSGPPGAPYRPVQTQPMVRTPAPPPGLSLPPHFDRDSSGQLRPQDGYEWTNAKRTAVKWVPGKTSRQNPHVVASDTEGDWEPEEGYAWVAPNKPKDKSVKWVPGTPSNKHQNIVAGPVEGQWRPADGYTWLFNPPRPGDMRVRSVASAIAAPSLIPADPFQQGLADRAELERWVGGLTGDSRRGAEWWAGRRSQPNAGTCGGLPGLSPEFISGCEAAKARLIPIDLKRKSDPEYRRGFNTYTSTTTPQTAAAGPTPAAPVPFLENLQVPNAQVNPTPGRDEDSADRLNAQELQRLRGR